jgi:hypothetical protein
MLGGQKLRPQWERDLPEHERDALDRSRAQVEHFASWTAMHGDGRDRMLLRIEAKLDELLRRLPPPPIDQRQEHDSPSYQDGAQRG